MSLQAEPILDIPELTAQVARAAFPRGVIYLELRDELGTSRRQAFLQTCMHMMGNRP